MTKAKGDPHPAHAGSRARVEWGPALGIAVALGGVMLFTHRIVAIDDAFISYRYAANLAHSGQFVFNLGERVEGATNLLWILVLAASDFITHIPLEQLSIGISLVLIVFAVARCHMTLRLTGLTPWTSTLIVIAVFGLGDVFLSMTTGLEAALYVALTSEGLFAVQMRRLRMLGIWIGLMFMTRPEGAIVGALLLIPFLPPFSRERTVLRALLPATLIIVGTTLWRFFYFGAWIPNSIIDKSFPLEILPGVLKALSMPYFAAFAAADISLVAILCMAIADIGTALAGLARNEARQEIATSLTIFLVIIASWLIVARNGGDWMPHFRLLTQYAPFYCLGFGFACRRWPRLDNLAPAILAGITAWPLSQHLLATGCCGISVETEPPAGIFSEAAQKLKPILRPSDVVSAEAAGLLPYRLLSTRIHDPVGLMDPYIAHHGTPAIPFGKTDVNYTFEQIRPTFMVWHWSGHIFKASQAARDQYVAFCYSRCDHTKSASIILVRKDRVDEIITKAFSSWSIWNRINKLSADSDFIN